MLTICINNTLIQIHILAYKICVVRTRSKSDLLRCVTGKRYRNYYLECKTVLVEVVHVLANLVAFNLDKYQSCCFLNK